MKCVTQNIVHIVYKQIILLHGLEYDTEMSLCWYWFYYIYHIWRLQMNVGLNELETIDMFGIFYHRFDTHVGFVGYYFYISL